MISWAAIVLTLITTSYAESKIQNVGVIEEPIERFAYFPGIKSSDIEIQNVHLEKGDICMRNGVENHSLVRWEPPSTSENWAFSFKINYPDLNSDEFAGIYLRYTKEESLTGQFKGGSGAFDGIMVGLEIRGKSTAIVYATNNGQEYTEAPEIIRHVIQHDEINPRRFENVKEITFKVINTSKNLKIEIYNEDELIYDNFRIYDYRGHGFNAPGGYFAIIADYPNAASNKAYKLLKAQLYKRVETSEYTPTRSYMPRLEHNIREIHQIQHHDGNIKLLLHQQETVIKMLKDTFGKLPETKIYEIQHEVSKDLSLLAEKLKKLSSLKIKQKTNMNLRLNEFDIKIKNIQRSLGDFEYEIGNIKNDKLSVHHSLLSYAIFASGCLGLYVLGSREFSSLQSKKKVLNK